jgi:hypothetical protein
MHNLQVTDKMLTRQNYGLVFLNKLQASELVETIQVSHILTVVLIVSQLSN